MVILPPETVASRGYLRSGKYPALCISVDGYLWTAPKQGGTNFRKKRRAQLIREDMEILDFIMAEDC